MNDTSHQAKTGGVPNRGSLYAVAAAHSKEAIETLYDLMKNSQNEGIRLGAAKAILNKTIPDLRASEGEDYIPPTPLTHTISPRFAKIMEDILNDTRKSTISTP